MDTKSNFLAQIRPSLVLTLAVFLGTGLAYPALVTSLAKVLFPRQAEGSLVSAGQAKASRLLGQAFASDSFFQARPSAAGAGWDASASSGSNVGPLNQVWLDTVLPARVAAYRLREGLAATATVPPDAVTASASGLDPDITLANALLQAPRVARVRGLSLTALQSQIHALARVGFWHQGPSTPVNAVDLNFALEGGHVP